MKLDYGTYISPAPIRLSIGTLRKPTLNDIAEVSFDKYDYYKFIASLNTETYYTVLRSEEGGKEQWENMAEEERRQPIYEIMMTDKKLKSIFLEMLNWFFVENVIAVEPYIVILYGEVKPMDEIQQEDIKGIITEDTFPDVINYIKQICCISTDDEEEEAPPKFKNKLAERMYNKMKKAKQTKKADINLSLPNIIDAVNGKHPSLNYTNIWGLTVPQLVRTFNRLQLGALYEINSTTVSVWGDEKRTFDASLWYKNEYDKKEDPS